MKFYVDIVFKVSKEVGNGNEFDTTAFTQEPYTRHRFLDNKTFEELGMVVNVPLRKLVFEAVQTRHLRIMTRGDTMV